MALIGSSSLRSTDFQRAYSPVMQNGAFSASARGDDAHARHSPRSMSSHMPTSSAQADGRVGARQQRHRAEGPRRCRLLVGGSTDRPACLNSAAHSGLGKCERHGCATLVHSAPMKYLVYACASLVYCAARLWLRRRRAACRRAARRSRRVLLRSRDPRTARRCTEAGGVTVTKDSDLVADGYTTVGSAFTFTGAGPFPHGIDFVLPYSAGKVSDDLARRRAGQEAQLGGARRRGVERRRRERARARCTSTRPTSPRIQIAVAKTSGTKVTRHYTYPRHRRRLDGRLRLVGELLAHPERYDAIGVMGADPGPGHDLHARHDPRLLLLRLLQRRRRREHDRRSSARPSASCSPTRASACRRSSRSSTSRAKAWA